MAEASRFTEHVGSVSGSLEVTCPHNRLWREFRQQVRVLSHYAQLDSFWCCLLLRTSPIFMLFGVHADRFTLF